jgi:hypothetical protein
MKARRLAVLALLVAVVVSCASCGGYSGTPAQQMQQWSQQYAIPGDISQVLSDAGRIGLAANQGAAKKMRTVCGGLSYDTGTLGGNLPAPDRKVSGEIAKGVQTLFDAAEVCAVESSTTSARTKGALAGIGRGAAALRHVQRELAGLGVH